MTGFSAVEAELLFYAAFAFFWGEFGDFDGIDDHGVRVMCLGVGGVGEGVVGLVGGFQVSLGDVVSPFPLGLEGDSLLVPFIDGGRDGVHGHDAAHQRWWDSGGEIPNQDVGVRDISQGNVVLECGNIFR